MTNCANTKGCVLNLSVSVSVGVGGNLSLVFVKHVMFKFFCFFCFANFLFFFSFFVWHHVFVVVAVFFNAFCFFGCCTCVIKLLKTKENKRKESVIIQKIYHLDFSKIITLSLLNMDVVFYIYNNQLVIITNDYYKQNILIQIHLKKI